jgi:hypothetical protein
VVGCAVLCKYRYYLRFSESEREREVTNCILQKYYLYLPKTEKYNTI